MYVSEIMTRDVVTCSVDEMLPDAAAKMQSENIGCCPVLDQERLVGMLTDRDIAIRAVAKGFDLNSTTVGEIMTTSIVTGSPWMSLENACRVLSDNQIRRLPILDGERLVGIVSLADLAIDLEEDEMLAETLMKISEPSR